MKEIIIQYALRIRESLMSEVKESAEKHDRTIAQELRELIRKGLKK